MSTPPDPLKRFTGLAETYDAHRPRYPRPALEALLAELSECPRALDVGCGTGISARWLASRCGTVLGIDPNIEMLQRARQAGREHGLWWLAARAEQLPLSAGWADLVLCAQSFHWFVEQRAWQELHRVLKPGGRLALMWNVRDGEDSFTGAYGGIVRRAQDAAEAEGMLTPRGRSAHPAAGLFGELRFMEFSNAQALDRKGLLGRARSASYFPREGALRQELEDALRALFKAWEVDGRVRLVYRTELTLATRL